MKNHAPSILVTLAKPHIAKKRDSSRLKTSFVQETLEIQDGTSVLNWQISSSPVKKKWRQTVGESEERRRLIEKRWPSSKLKYWNFGRQKVKKWAGRLERLGESYRQGGKIFKLKNRKLDCATESTTKQTNLAFKYLLCIYCLTLYCYNIQYLKTQNILFYC